MNGWYTKGPLRLLKLSELMAAASFASLEPPFSDFFA